MEENCCLLGPVGVAAAAGEGDGLGANLLGAIFGFKGATAGPVLFTGLVVERLLVFEMVFSGMSLEPVAFSLGMPLAKRPPRPRGDGDAPLALNPAPELPPPEVLPPLGPEGADEPALGLSEMEEK